jgi:hypothetical protein
MKALSLTRPWATLAALGEKGWDTRSRRFHHYGFTAIHSSDSFPANLLETYPGGLEEVYELPFFKEALLKHGYHSPELLPTSAILGIVQIVRYVKTSIIRDELSEKEKAFGLYTDGRWAYQLADHQPLIKPMPCPGQQGLWNVPRDIMEEIRIQNPGLKTQTPFSLPI